MEKVGDYGAAGKFYGPGLEAGKAVIGAEDLNTAYRMGRLAAESEKGNLLPEFLERNPRGLAQTLLRGGETAQRFADLVDEMAGKPGPWWLGGKKKNARKSKAKKRGGN
jgi:hypothetical protein